jgi:hypothetical protein
MGTCIAGAIMVYCDCDDSMPSDEDPVERLLLRGM